MSRADELRAELALLDLESEFRAAKETGTVIREQKLALREARQAFREQREGVAIVQPDTVEATAAIPEV